MNPDPADEQLSEGVLGTSSIVFMVMAVSAPLAVVVALMPIAFAFGNGAGVPGIWLLAVVAMLLFAVGYVRLIPYVRNAGAFYAYISASVGKTIGLSAAYVAATSYFALACSTLAVLAFFSADLFLSTTGVQTRWELWAAIAVAVLLFFSYHRITLAATVLSFALVGEIAVVIVLGIAVLIDRGFPAFNVNDFSVGTVFGPGFGIALIYSFNSLIGFEGTAIYQEEARNRRVTIPRATYISVVIVGLFYVLTAWMLSSGVGSDKVSEIAAADPGHFVTKVAADHLGVWGPRAFSILVLTSAFAAVLGLFNNTTRYLYALARDGVLPRILAKTHKRYGSPHVAGLVLSVVLVIVMGLCALAGLDPLLNISTSLTGLGSVGLMVLLAITSLAIPIYFARARSYGFKSIVAPALGGILILAAVWLALDNYSALTGVDSKVINSLPWILVIVAGLGIFQALWLKVNRPSDYENIARSRVEETTSVDEPRNGSPKFAEQAADDLV